MEGMLREIGGAVEKRREEAISFLQRLIRTPSPTRQEAEAARVVAGEMRAIGYDEVSVDRLSDVMGIMKGTGGGRSILFNGHLDHVPPGDMDDPYSGRLMEGAPFGVEGEVVYGRAASDMKGALAAMVMAGKILRDLGIRLRGDFKVAAVAQEETVGAGSIATIEEAEFLADLVVIGEATNMDLALGHRGGVRADVVVSGKSCHASAPERGVNALYGATDLIARIRSELIPRLPDHPVYGRTTLAVTRISVKPDTPNVVPEECKFHIDCRNNPDYPAEKLAIDLEEIIAGMKEADPELDAQVLPSRRPVSARSFTGFYTDPGDHPIVCEARDAVAEALGRQPEMKVWKFATDGRFYFWRGIPVIGLGPGEERFTHTNEDHIRVEDYLQSIKAYAWLTCRICGVAEK
ncbi:MAG: M20/M25/M40 family metallo-hydrolase [Candidatus Bathyarchaeota archaeon]|nr:MAG: M20/M25/M40 family metallo-hydrolase [Candidatus Bathyarchaeota archaeon]